jgi:Flp pilus assembly pilin Flp
MAFAGRINRIRSRWSRSEAQTMAEYAIILGVITPAIVIAFALFAAQIEAAYQRIIGFFT